MSLVNGNGATVWRTVLAGLILAAAVGAWKLTGELSTIGARLFAIEQNFLKIDERLTYLERQERRR